MKLRLSKLLFTFSVIVILGVTSSVPVFAQDLQLEKEIFSSSFFNKLPLNQYYYGFCYRNIKLLLERFLENQIALEEAYVLVLYSKDPSGTHYGLWLNRPRSAPESASTTEGSADFHVVLMHKGHVFDFDYSDEPTILPAHLYFSTALSPKTGDLYVRSFPAKDYFSIYQGNYYNLLINNAFPDKPLRLYLEISN